MPELPEVETVRKTLQQLVVGKTIKAVEVLLPRIVRQPEPEQFINTLKGKTITAIDRRGKYLLFRIGNLTLVSHLRMEGNYGLFSNKEARQKHTHIVFVFTDGTELRYRDVRQFGTMDLVASDNIAACPGLDKLGLEPFSEEWTELEFIEAIQKRKKNIKAILLDQCVVAGIGNIYADEILFRANISPETDAFRLTIEKIKALYYHTGEVLKEAIAAGGSSVKSYVNGQGKMGMFQQNLYVYQRHGKPCRICGHDIEKTRVAGRGTHYCPNCQKDSSHE